MESNLINVIYRVLFWTLGPVAILGWERYIGRCRAGEFDGDGTYSACRELASIWRWYVCVRESDRVPRNATPARDASYLSRLCLRPPARCTLNWLDRLDNARGRGLRSLIDHVRTDRSILARRRLLFLSCNNIRSRCVHVRTAKIQGSSRCYASYSCLAPLLPTLAAASASRCMHDSISIALITQLAQNGKTRT
jgi:hypothetical protein